MTFVTKDAILDVTSPVPEELLAGLNPEQREAVRYRGSALLIVAGAGSGKTSVLTRRIAGLLQTHEAYPSQILAITFTNKAAGEMRERLAELLGEKTSGMWISTFHSACVRILRRHAEALGMKAGFTIYDAGDTRALLKQVIKDLGYDTSLTAPRVQTRISRLKNELTDVDSYARSVRVSDSAEAKFVKVFRLYNARLSGANAFDFDDLIAKTVELFNAFPEIAALYQSRFRHVLVDEYQDTNHAQYALIHELTRPVLRKDVPPDTRIAVDNKGRIPAASLTVVGDSDQSIYAFRGADIRNITEFERDFPSARVIRLEQNYRSTQNILDAANEVISRIVDRQEKKLFTDSGLGEKIIGYTGYSSDDEAQFVADEIARLHAEGIAYADMAIFVRVNAQTRVLEDILIRSAIPYRIAGGTRFFDRAEIKDVLAYLALAVNPADDLALRRIMNVPKRGIGPATEAVLQAHADKIGVPLREALRESGALNLGKKVTEAIQKLSDILDNAEEMVNRGVAPADILSALLTGTGYLSILRDTRDAQDEARAENVEELLSFTGEFAKRNPEGNLIDFLTEVALMAATDDIGDSSDQVTLMTLHTAKGLEYDTVFITGVEEGLLPHKNSLGKLPKVEEERRLFYVGITRARRRLFLSLAMTRATFGETGAAMQSRFVQDIPDELIDWRQSPGEVNSRGGTRSRALNANGRRRGGWQARDAELPETEKPVWKSPITGVVRDNGELVLDLGDKIRHSDFGVGQVVGVSGAGPKTIAEVRFEDGGHKRLVVKIAPIEKL